MGRNNRNTYEKQRESLRQKELKRNTRGNMSDSFHRAEHGSLVDLVVSLGWKGTGLLILFLVIGFLVVSFLIN